MSNNQRNLLTQATRRCSWKKGVFQRRGQSSFAEPRVTTPGDNCPKPEFWQLRNHFIKAAVPMIGFGFMDQTIMIQAGNAIDCSIGVTFGLSTMTAAAMGQVCSDGAGVLFGGTVDSMVRFFGMPGTGFTTPQRYLAVVKRVGLAGQFLGVILGCMLGLLNLSLIDTERSSTLKLKADEGSSNNQTFEIEVTNLLREDATTAIVRGPDVDGILAAMTAAVNTKGYSVMELHATRAENDDENTSSGQERIEDIFVIVDKNTKEQIPEEDLDDLASTILDATKHPMNFRSFKAQVQELEETRTSLQSRIDHLERLMHDRQVKVVPALQNTS